MLTNWKLAEIQQRAAGGSMYQDVMMLIAEIRQLHKDKICRLIKSWWVEEDILWVSALCPQCGYNVTIEFGEESEYLTPREKINEVRHTGCPKCRASIQVEMCLWQAEPVVDE